MVEKGICFCRALLRGVQVMLDFDLAAIYGYTTKRFNEQVKNNIERFDDDFRFQLTELEFKNLMSKISTSSSAGSKDDNLRSKISTSSWGRQLHQFEDIGPVEISAIRSEGHHFQRQRKPRSAPDRVDRFPKRIPSC